MVYDTENEDFVMEVKRSGLLPIWVLDIIIILFGVYALYELACYLMEVL